MIVADPAAGASNAFRIRLRPPFRRQTSAHPTKVQVQKMRRVREKAAIDGKQFALKHPERRGSDGSHSPHHLKFRLRPLLRAVAGKYNARRNLDQVYSFSSI